MAEARLTVDQAPSRRRGSEREELRSARWASRGQRPNRGREAAASRQRRDRRLASVRDLAGGKDRHAQKVAELDKAVDVAAEASMTAEEGLRSWLEQFGIASIESPDRDLALVEAGKRAEIEEMEKTSSMRELEGELAVERGHVRVASALGTHLKANNFEAWLLEEAMEVLIDGANRLLDELSGGGYSLRVRKSQFEVVDHRNAN